MRTDDQSNGGSPSRHTFLTEHGQRWVEIHDPEELHEARKEVRGREYQRLVLVDDRVRSYNPIPPELEQFHRPAAKTNDHNGGATPNEEMGELCHINVRPIRTAILFSLFLPPASHTDRSRPRKQ